MGLKIIAFEKAKLISENFKAKAEEIDFDGEVFRAKVNPDFEAHDHLATGIYSAGGEGIEFMAGSYGTYNGLRRQLSLMAHDKEPQEIWNDRERYKGRDFYELIDFSDCEGVIGPTTAGKLYYDFRSYREAYHMQNNEWDNEVYDNWMKAMELASNDGIIIFC